MVEIDGRRAIAEGDFPLRALLQVKGTEQDGPSFVVDISVGKIKRWSAQPLPVFIVGVSTMTERFFAKSIDEIVTDDLGGRDPFEIDAKTIRVRLAPVEDLGLTVQEAIRAHYASSRLRLVNVPDVEITGHYFEVIARRDPESTSIPTAVWTVLWKSPPRPQHFATMVTELVRRARGHYARADLEPFLFFFSIFRSLEDRHCNLATARVEVVNPDHPRANELRRHLKMPDGYNVRRDRDLAESREYWQSITMAAATFRGYAEGVGSALDALTTAVFERLREPVVWDDGLDAAFKTITEVWGNQTVAPAECRMLERVLEEQYQCLLEHRLISRNTRNTYSPPAVRDEMLRERETKLRQCLGSWAIVLRNES